MIDADGQGLVEKALDQFQKLRRVVLVVDVVDSVRLMEIDEQGTIVRWLKLSTQIERDISTMFSGRVVKSLGDGLLAEFDTPRAAVAAAIQIQRQASLLDGPGEEKIRLRIGIEVADIIVGARDIFGQGVNIAARLAGLAPAGGIVVSAQFREFITQDIDSDIEDLGLCYVKNLSQPLRAYRIGPARADASRPPPEDRSPIGPTLAVIPFECASADPADRAIGEILADEIIETLSPSINVNVLSRLSTSSLRDRGSSLDAIRATLGAHYVLTGAYFVSGGRVRLHVEFAETATGKAIWSEGFRFDVASIVDGEQEIVGRILDRVSEAIASLFVVRVRRARLPTVETHTLMIAAIALINRLSSADIDLASAILEETRIRAPRHPAPSAWLAHLHVMRVQQGFAADVDEAGRIALDHARRALDLDPHCALALTMEGLVETHFRKRPDRALERFEQAVASNPNLGLGWLLMGTTEAFVGNGPAAYWKTTRSRMLSPLDPQRDYYNSLSATACLADDRNEEALDLAERSLRANRIHTSTYRVKIAALWRLGRRAEALETAARLRALEPGLTVSGWLRRSPTAGFPLGREFAETMRHVGIPD
jgi:adenylate cyclase